MYNKEQGYWESGRYDQSQLNWYAEPENREKPEALFIRADTLLAQAAKGKQTAEAVYLMEKAAKLGYARAALAMGQMFQYGWAVSRSRKLAMRWYGEASRLGDLEAAALLAEGKRQRRLRFAAVAAAVVLILGAVCGLVRWRMPSVQGVRVHKNTELVQTANLEDFSRALNELVAQYDDELVISGQRGSNRLMLRFEGAGIDLSGFPAAVVIDSGDNYLVIQFHSEEEAQKCLEMLKNTRGILFVEEDSYGINTNQILTDGDLTSTGVPYDSPYTGYSYYSWGVEYLGLDRLAAWIMNQNVPAVTVAVVDTGSEPCAENAHLYLEGFDMISGNSNGWNDLVGHGTHVAGTIIDCTRGLDVKILPVRVLGPNRSPDSVIVLGLQYAIASGVDVINMSLGGPCSRTDPLGTCGGAIDYYIQTAVAQGIIVVVSAGNGDDHGNPVDTNGICPAHNGNCIVVAACDSGDRLASFSNYGETVDVCAPGVDVVSYYPGGTLESLDGTSMAAPHISALVAMLKMLMPDRTPAQIENYLTDYCVDMGNPTAYGEGIPWAGYFAGN